MIQPSKLGISPTMDVVLSKKGGCAWGKYGKMMINHTGLLGYSEFY
jgi:hypothetical protein